MHRFFEFYYCGLLIYVIVHAGFALSILDRDEAEQTLNYLRQLNTR
jgi:hydrogenase maturation factor